MNNYNPNIHHRRTIRLKGYDYSQAGLYFITICVKDRVHLFGEIVDGKMILNNAGKIAVECWSEIPEHFPNAILHEYIIMPNHIHGIIELHGNETVRTSHVMSVPHHDEIPVGSRHVVTLPCNIGCGAGPSHVMPRQNQFSKPIPGSISVIIQQFKSSVTRNCNKNGNSHFRWQSRFYEHIIRDDQSYNKIADYIENNPANWLKGKLHNK